MQQVDLKEPAATAAAPATASNPSSRRQSQDVPRGHMAPPLEPSAAKGKAKKASVPPYLRIGGKRSALERAMKERLLECPQPRKEKGKGNSGVSGDLEPRKEDALQPFPRLRKPAEVVEVELDQLRQKLQKEIRERRRDARRRRQMRRRCRLQASETGGHFVYFAR